MLPMITLVVVTLLTRGIGLLGIDGLDSWVAAVRLGLAVMFALTASAHFAPPRRDALIAMVPAGLPRPALLVTATGVLEAAGAIGLLIPATSRLAAVCLGLLLVAMFPANVHDARHRRAMRTMPLPVRTIVQAVFVAACAFVAFG